MKILSVSDFAERIFYDDPLDDRFKGVDLVLSCGDLPPEYLTFLTSRLRAPLYYVRGNHDLRYAAKPPGGCLDAHGRILRYQGLRILGLEGARWYNGGPSQYTEAQMRKIIWGLRPKIWWAGGLDIIITHAPPRHIHDAEDECHQGFRVYRALIEKYAPRYFIHGHIHTHFTHPEDRTTVVNGTRVVNTYGYHLFELDHAEPV